MKSEFIEFVRDIYKTTDFIPLHEPRFIGNEKKYLQDCIDSTFVSSVGEYVNRLEKDFAETVGSKHAVATVNGTAALHAALMVAGVGENDEVLTQALTFVATANAIRYTRAFPVFLDTDRDTLGLSPEAVQNFLENNCTLKQGRCINNTTGRVVKVCLPMHTFGHPCRINEIAGICDKWSIAVIEDAAESLGSYYRGRHTGTFGRAGTFSFNGNKIITSGGGGIVVTDDDAFAKRVRHLTTTAKVPHPWEYVHDEVGYNYRLPNLNAALLVAQLENLARFLKSKRNLSQKYRSFFQTRVENYIAEPEGAQSNYWLNAIVFEDSKAKNEFLEYTNRQGVMTRPIWTLMNHLAMYQECQTDSLINSRWLAERVVNIPSSVIL